MSNGYRFPVKRIAVTVPPHKWFHGIARAMFEIYRQGLVDLGFQIFDVPVDAFVVPDATHIAALLADLKTFQPEMAFGLPKGSHALICRMPARRDGWRPNLFTEVLEIPTICLWDHAPSELADQLLMQAANPGESVAGAQETLRRYLRHPLLIHWSPDTGQTQLMEELGFLQPNAAIQEPLPSLPGFQRQKARVPADGVGFVGHFYQDQPAYPHAALGSLADGVIQEWLDNIDNSSGRPLWYVLADHTARMGRDLRTRLALHPDQTYFWHFAHRLIVHRAQTARRLKVLGAAGVPVACYGNLRTDVPDVPRNLTSIPGSIPFGPELAAALTRHPVTIDVFNPGSIHGFSHKPVMTFAAGGFMLADRRRDFIHAFGDAGEAVSYDRDLGAKIERFLTNPKHRTEVRDAIRETISTRFQLRDVLTRVLDAAFRGTENIRDRQTPAGHLDPPLQIVAKNLLKEIRSRIEWSGASVEFKDGTALVAAPQQWGYAAAITIPGNVKSMREPHLRLSLIVEAGRIGVAALLDDTGALIAEQFASATNGPIGITVELPRKGVSTVILRNTVEVVSRARVLEASLCDRIKRPA